MDIAKAEPDREELYAESVRRFNARRRRQIRAEWYGWHCDQAERHRRTLEALIVYRFSEIALWHPLLVRFLFGDGGVATLRPYAGCSLQDAGYELPRIHLLRRWVNKG